LSPASAGLIFLSAVAIFCGEGAALVPPFSSQGLVRREP
jgi:hypothetical protein